MMWYVCILFAQKQNLIVWKRIRTNCQSIWIENIKTWNWLIPGQNIWQFRCNAFRNNAVRAFARQWVIGVCQTKCQIWEALYVLHRIKALSILFFLKQWRLKYTKSIYETSNVIALKKCQEEFYLGVGAQAAQCFLKVDIPTSEFSNILGGQFFQI